MFSALPYTPHEMENAMHPYELPAIHYNRCPCRKGRRWVLEEMTAGVPAPIRNTFWIPMER